MADKWDEFREKLGKGTVDRLLDILGLNPNRVPKEPKKYECPKCHGKNARHREAHADTDMNCMELYCPDCRYSKELD